MASGVTVVSATVDGWCCPILSASPPTWGLGARAANQQAPQYYLKPYSRSGLRQAKTEKM
jgi:hypothetical protein